MINKAAFMLDEFRARPAILPDALDVGRMCFGHGVSRRAIKVDSPLRETPSVPRDV